MNVRYPFVRHAVCCLALILLLCCLGCLSACAEPEQVGYGYRLVVDYPSSITAGEDVVINIHPLEDADFYAVSVHSGQYCVYDDGSASPGTYTIPSAVFSEGGWFHVRCGAYANGSEEYPENVGEYFAEYDDVLPASGLAPLQASVTGSAQKGRSVPFSLSVNNPSRVLVEQYMPWTDFSFQDEGGDWTFVADLDGSKTSFTGQMFPAEIRSTFRFSALVNGRWTAWSEPVTAPRPAMLDFFPRSTLPVGAALDFYFGDFDKSVDQYVHVLKRESGGTRTNVFCMKAWDASSGTADEWIPAGTITEAGDYCLTFGSDPDYTGISPSLVAVKSFRALSGALATPVISDLSCSVAGGSVTASVSFPQGTESSYITVGRVVNGMYTYDYWTDDREVSMLGIQTTEPGTYEIRAIACNHFLGEDSPGVVADSAMAVLSFTLAASDIPVCPEVVLDLENPELDYDGQTRSVSYTIPGAEAVTCCWSLINPLTGEEIEGVPTPVTFTEGATGSFSVCAAGRYVVTCWARFGGIWSAESEPVYVTVNPLGCLGKASVSWLGIPVGETLVLDTADLPVFTVSCENADQIYYDVFRLFDDEDEEYLTSDTVDADASGEAEIDLSSLGLTAGSYWIRFLPQTDGWYDSGFTEVVLTVADVGARSGACGKNVSWAYSDGVLYITGSGTMEDYLPFSSNEGSAAPWKEFDVSSVVFRGSVTRIGDWTFQGQKHLTAVQLPDTLKSIGEGAFTASGLTGTLVIPSGVTFIDDYAFSGNRLSAVVLPDGLRHIGHESFCDNASLSSVTVPEGVEVKEHIFYEEQFREGEPPLVFAFCLNLPASVTRATESAFALCGFTHAEPDFVLPASLQSVGSEALSGVAAGYIWIPDGTLSLAEDAFKDCPNLKYVRIPGDCEIISAETGGSFPAGIVILGEYDSPADDYAMDHHLRFLTPYAAGGNG